MKSSFLTSLPKERKVVIQLQICLVNCTTTVKEVHRQHALCVREGGGGQSCAPAPTFALLLLHNNSNVKVGLAHETREG